MQAANDQWQQRKSEIEHDTQVTIETTKKAIDDATKKAKAELEQLKADGRKLRGDFDEVAQAQQRAYEKNLSDIDGLEYSKKVLHQTNIDLSAENRTLQSEITVKTEELASLKDEVDTLNGRVTTLHEDELSLTATIAGLSTDAAARTDELEELVEEIANKTETAERELAILTAKKDAVMQEIIENRAQDDKTRENLANWHKDLTEQEKSLRIREARASEQEQSIVRNYNLLSL